MRSLDPQLPLPVAELSDATAMQRALQLAELGIGLVEPNPAVGAVITSPQGDWLADGFHPRFGGPHAEVVALQQAGDRARGGTLYVTLEPCSHFGKTPPCADAVIAAGIARVVVATVDPAPHVAGAGIARLRAAGIQVDVGLCAEQATALIAPFTKLFTKHLPYVHAKWAMTLDGKMASWTGSSKWITNALSRERVHQLRGRMDAILTGIGTVLADDPQLTARPAGPRTATRVVLDSHARLPLNSQLVQTARQAPVLLCVSAAAPVAAREALTAAGVEVLVVPAQPCVESDSATGVATQGHGLSLSAIFEELGRRQLTNVLVEAGGKLLGACLQAGYVDEVHCFVAPKLIGGSTATPWSTRGIAKMQDALNVEILRTEVLAGDVYLHGKLIQTNVQNN